MRTIHRQISEAFKSNNLALQCVVSGGRSLENGAGFVQGIRCPVRRKERFHRRTRQTGANVLSINLTVQAEFVKFDHGTMEVTKVS